MERLQYYARYAATIIDVAGDAQRIIDKYPELEKEEDRDIIRRLLKEGHEFLLLLEDATHSNEEIEKARKGLEDLYFGVSWIRNRYNKHYEKQRYFELFRKESGSSAGKKSGAVRAKKAQETWHKLALELAKQSRKEKPANSIEKIASYVSDNWKNGKILCPGHTTLKVAISRWIKEKKLPEKTRQ